MVTESQLEQSQTETTTTGGELLETNIEENIPESIDSMPAIPESQEDMPVMQESDVPELPVE